LAGRQIVTITTDFGDQDHFVGVMKGVILNINPDAILVDISHQVHSYDIFDGAYTLAQSCHYFPLDTIHLVVVDPGVGSGRRPLLVRTKNYKFVTPDNGVLSLVYEREENVEVRHITADHYFLQPVSNTFHGRDVFAPVAGWLSRGLEADKFGEVVTDYVRFASPRPKRLDDHALKGVVLKVDKFGNLITNIRPEDVPQLFAVDPAPFRMIINQKEVSKLTTSYSAGSPSELFVISGSSGFLEIATCRGSAARALNVNRGAEVELRLAGSLAPQ
jgi:S-adenosyl-L-methionine hydrolase (adenosine-forming)